VTGSVAAPPKAATAEYGQYFVNVIGCQGCHGPELDGHPTSPLLPVGANLRVVKGWSAQEFITTLRTGVDPSGHHLNDNMPWRPVGRLDDVELAGIHAYLQTFN